jgi:hypothetical protein
MIVTPVEDDSAKQSIVVDINNDGVDDLIGVDLLTQSLVVLVTGTEEQAAISKIVVGVSDISELSGVSMDIDGNIIVTTTKQQ